MLCGIVFVAESVADIQTQPESAVLKQKKNFKIWFSPRSRKVRCQVEKPSEEAVPGSRSPGATVAAQPDTPAAQRQDLSVFNFTSSSQDSSSSQKCNNVKKKRQMRPQKNPKGGYEQVRGVTRTTRKQTKQNIKKKRLKAINQQWGINEEQHAASELEHISADGARRSSKRVSFRSPTVASDERQLETPQGITNELSPACSTIRDNLSGGSNSALNYQTQPFQSMSNDVNQQEKISANDSNPEENSEKHDKISPSENLSKRIRVEEENVTLETTPKRPRASPQRRRKSLGWMSPAVLNPPSSATPKSDKSTKSSRRDEKVGSSVIPLAVLESHSKSPCSPGSSVGRPSPGSPAVMKKNHKGETLLHLAAIKVESL